MKRVRNGLLLIVALIFTQFLSAQRLSLQLTGGIAFPDSAQIGGPTDSIQVLITNTDTINPYTGELYFWYSINGSVQDSSNALGAAISFQKENSVTIGPDSGIVRTIYIDYNPARFSVGPSVVIIWPIALPTILVDSLIGQVTIFPYLGIEKLADNSPELYWANKSLVIQDLNSKLNRVRIFDLEGRLLIDNQLETSTILPLNGLSRGTYFAEVLYSNNRRKVLQFVTQ
jgi:hypothetical protein